MEIMLYGNPVLRKKSEPVEVDENAINLAKKMIELNHNKYLLQLFIENKLTHGTDEMIKVMGLLQEHPQWKDKASEDYKKEIALNILKDYENRIAETDELIDRIVYHLYGLKEEDINIIIKGC